MSMTKKWGDLGSGIGFLTPNIIGFVIFTLFPVFAALMLSFTQWDASGLETLSFVGFMNYAELMKDPDFWYYLVNTLIFMAAIPVGMATSLGLALAMNQKLKGIVAFRTMYFLPYISSMVAVALVFQWIYNANSGLLNEMLKMIGFTDPPNWLGSKLWARPAIIIMQVWKNAGYNMMIYLAALQSIPHALYEAADIDGATGWNKFTKITLPQLAPTNFFVIVMGLITGFQMFAEPYVLTNGGPDGATTSVVFQIYKKAFQSPIEMGYATAISVLLFAMMMIVTLIQWSVTNDEAN